MTAQYANHSWRRRTLGPRPLLRRGGVLALIALLFAGCASAAGPYSPRTEAHRRPSHAERLTLDAAAVMDSDPSRAEKLLRQALTEDLYHGPAHNNLGVLFLRQGRLYDAASEFQWARQLLPGHPDPRLNLGLALERAGRVSDALEAYASALDVYPEHLQSMQALARCQLRHARADDRTNGYLREIAFRGDDHWRVWAQSQLIRNAPGSVESPPADGASN